QEVFLDFHRRHPADAPYAPGWLYRAAAHTALNRLRSRKRRQRRELASVDPAPAGSAQDPHDILLTREDRRELREALGRLPTKAARRVRAALDVAPAPVDPDGAYARLSARLPTAAAGRGALRLPALPRVSWRKPALATGLAAALVALLAFTPLAANLQQLLQP